MEKRKCLIYGNCQGGALGYFLQKSPQFKKNFEIEYLQNFSLMQEHKSLPLNSLYKSDLFIYQPLKKIEHGDYRTEIVKSYLPSHCQTISFPYLYNDALWPLFKNGDQVINEEPIVQLINQNASIVDIMFLFLNLKIDFRFKERFEKSIEILKRKEGECDVKAVGYILKNMKSERLFLTLNHPASGLLIHCANQILSLLNYPPLEKSHHPNEARLPGCLPISPYEKNFYGFNYQDNWRQHFDKRKQGNWKHAYLKCILEIYLNINSFKQKNMKFYISKFQGKLIRSICKFIR